jgi:two-component system, chemotaxis family, CheB/CheR fusion protein
MNETIEESAGPIESVPFQGLGVDILESLDLPVLVIGCDCKVSGFNQAAATLFSLGPWDAGLSVREIPLFSSIKLFEELCADVIRNGIPSQGEVRDAKGCWFVLRIAAYRGSDRQIVGALLTLTNVTVVRESLEQAVHDREYTKAIINTVIDPLVVLDEDLQIQTANQSFYTMLKVSRQETQGVRILELGNTDWVPALQTILKNSGCANQPLDPIEVEHEFPTIGRRKVLLNARPISGKGNFKQLILLSIHDITARKRVEEELAESLEREKAAGRMKDNFLAMLSHELRTPLNPILLIASDSAHNPEIPAETRAQFEVILKNVEVEARLIDDLLDLSQVNHGKLKLNKQIVDAQTVLQEAINIVQGNIDEKQIRVTSRLNAEQHFISADVLRLQQIFWNILKNAIKFTSRGGKIIIETSSPIESGQFNIKISDNGMGMTPEELERLFSPFSQGDHVRDRFSNYGGLGLGLAISKKLVELHSGHIGAASDGRGCGASFVVEFPLAKR